MARRTFLSDLMSRMALAGWRDRQDDPKTALPDLLARSQLTDVRCQVEYSPFNTDVVDVVARRSKQAFYSVSKLLSHKASVLHRLFVFFPQRLFVYRTIVVVANLEHQ